MCSAAPARKVAICSRVTASPAPNVPSPRPAAMPAAATLLMLSSWVVPSSSAKRSSPGAIVVPVASTALTMNVAIWPRVTRPLGS